MAFFLSVFLLQFFFHNSLKCFRFLFIGKIQTRLAFIGGEGVEIRAGSEISELLIELLLPNQLFFRDVIEPDKIGTFRIVFH